MVEAADHHAGAPCIQQGDCEGVVAAGVVVGVEAHHAHVLERAGTGGRGLDRGSAGQAPGEQPLLAQGEERESEREDDAGGQCRRRDRGRRQWTTSGINLAPITSRTTIKTATTPSLRRSDKK